MNTNGNAYTIIYTTIIVIIVAAALAFAATSLKDKQDANEKADTISQMLTAAQFGTKADFQKMGNAAVLAKYAEELDKAFTVNSKGEKVSDITDGSVYSESDLKKQNYNIKGKGDGEPTLPVFVFKNGTTVVPIYGAGLWGPIWGYLAFESDHKTLKGAYFDHESETAGLGAKIKDDPAFQHEFCGEVPDFSASDKGDIFQIVKGGAPKENGESVKDNKVDAITGATMTSKGLAAAIDEWLAAYKPYFTGNASEADCCSEADSTCCSSADSTCCSVADSTAISK